MYSLLLKCSADEVDWLSGELWEAGTAGIQEWDAGGATLLVAAFENNQDREPLLAQFGAHAPQWRQESSIDWAEHSQAAWPPREVGRTIFLAPKWSTDPTPQGRTRLIHNPGLACGTGEHPCTQLALAAMEDALKPGDSVVDVGTGSGILAIAAILLGAVAVGVDTDEAAWAAARENFELNNLATRLITGSAECLADRCADVTVANINATVLLAILDDVVRITKANGRLILTGFTDMESTLFLKLFPRAEVTGIEDWRCITIENRPHNF